MVRGTQRKKLYRTMQGRMVDIEKLRSMNENIRAVGNMNVNARGDIMGPGGTILKSKEQVIKEYYEAPKGVVADTPVKRMAIPTPIPQNKVVETKVINPVKEPQPIEGIKQAKKIDIFKPKTVETKTPETKSGIDAALDGIE
tara:strand:- start:550 stop:975 length:426 start_codon:yes stop_codon:yes gene_type:complete